MALNQAKEHRTRIWCTRSEYVALNQAKRQYTRIWCSTVDLDKGYPTKLGYCASDQDKGHLTRLEHQIWKRGFKPGYIVQDHDKMH